jgi:hypothetical protein
MLHFVKRDHHIPKESIDAVQAANPEVLVRRGSRLQLQRSGELQSYNAEAAKLAKKRSLKFVRSIWEDFSMTYSFFGANPQRPRCLSRRNVRNSRSPSPGSCMFRKY